MKKNIIYIIIFLYIIISAKAQIITCDSIQFGLTPVTADSIADFIFNLKVNMDLRVTELNSDTVKLKTNVKIAQGLGPENLTAYLKKSDNIIPLQAWVDNQTGPQPFMDIQTLHIILPDKNDTDLFVSYDVIGTGFFFYILNLNHPDVFTYHYDYEHYYPMDIPIKKIGVSAPDSMQVFYSHKRDVNQKERINLTFMNKNHFQKEIIEVKNIQIDIYTPDSLINDTELLQRKTELKAYLSLLSPYVTSTKSFDFLLMNWRDEKNRKAFGRGFGNHFICDYRFSANAMLHEVLHIALPCEVEDLSKGEYFIKECIVDWLMYYLSDKIDLLDMVLEIKDQNLYDTHINDSSTWELIYSVGPAILQKIAIKSSEEQLAKAIISFLHEKEDKTTNYSEFIAHLKDYLSPDVIEYLDRMVKGN